jgi:hypothetical protein
MNALINSQFKEIGKFKKTYEEKYNKPFQSHLINTPGKKQKSKRKA